MPRAQSLTARVRTQQRPFILLRDYELREKEYDIRAIWCMECGGSFDEDGIDPDLKLEWDHLNANPAINELWNLQLIHAYCNRARSYMLRRRTPAAMRYQKRNAARMAANKAWQASFPFEKYFQQQRLEHFGTSEDGLFIDVSTLLEHHVKAVLEEYLSETGREFPIRELAAIVADRCQAASGHGSIQSARNHLLIRASPEGKYVKFQKGSTWYMARKPEGSGK